MKLNLPSPSAETKGIDKLISEAASIISTRQQADDIFIGIKGIKPWHIQAFHLISNPNGVKSAKQIAKQVGVSPITVSSSMKEGGILRRMISRAETSSLIKEAREDNFRQLAEMSPAAIKNISDFNHSENESLKFKNSWNIIKEVNGTSQPQITNSTDNRTVNLNLQLNAVEKIEIIKNRLQALAASQDIDKKNEAEEARQ